jgi:hypothetical protein
MTEKKERMISLGQKTHFRDDPLCRLRCAETPQQAKAAPKHAGQATFLFSPMLGRPITVDIQSAELMNGFGTAGRIQDNSGGGMNKASLCGKWAFFPLHSPLRTL